MALRSVDEEAWIDLSRTDTMDTELAAAPDEIRKGLLESSAEYVEVLGPLVFNHSRLDHAVLGNDDDRDLLERVFGTVHSDVQAPSAIPELISSFMKAITQHLVNYPYLLRSRRTPPLPRAGMRSQLAKERACWPPAAPSRSPHQPAHRVGATTT